MLASPVPESLPPAPLPVADDGGFPTDRGGRAWGGAAALVLSWGFLLALLFLSYRRIGATLAGPRVPVDFWVALASLALMVALAAWVTWRVLRRPPAGGRKRGDSQWAIAGRHFRRNRLAMAGLVVMIVLYALTLLTPLLAPYGPADMGTVASSGGLGPSLHHWFGTDKFGRDILSRVLYGSRISLSIGFIAVAISMSLGTLVGALAGYYGGWVDSALMRFTDMMLSFPRLVLLIVVIALFESSIWLVVLVLGLTGWMGTARIVRGEVLSLREREFIQAARALGMEDGRIIFRHIIPNTLAPVIVSATLGIGQTILTEASLSFLGLGVRPPTPSWGNMIADGRDALTQAWWISTFPGLAIVFTVIAFNLLGDGLRDALDPRLRT
ncbi:MAG: ABC-type dipeptide/oligopeptide/nickel transport system, permease component [Gemmatimonadetes bacterium]|nr:ABC-type dipeptide/oligopeptide/nickel transport system, permease component [Gemmatimonadota bacterium]